jgi:hypothetical protein
MTYVETMMKVEVVRSPRRRKTVSARQVGDGYASASPPP